MKIKIKVSFRTVSCNIEIDNAVIHYIITNTTDASPLNE
jgi:hypothetical protein